MCNTVHFFLGKNTTGGDRPSCPCPCSSTGEGTAPRGRRPAHSSPSPPPPAFTQQQHKMTSGAPAPSADDAAASTAAAVSAAFTRLDGALVDGSRKKAMKAVDDSAFVWGIVCLFLSFLRAHSRCARTQTDRLTFLLLTPAPPPSHNSPEAGADRPGRPGRPRLPAARGRAIRRRAGGARQGGRC